MNKMLNTLEKLLLAAVLFCGISILPAAEATADATPEETVQAANEEEEAIEEDEEEDSEEIAAPSSKIGPFCAVAALMGIGCISAAFAVAKIGTAVMGAAAEKPEVLGKAIPFVGLGEGIALFAFLISLFLIMRI